MVLGGGHSIGVPIAVSCDHSYIAETATMTIHPVRLTGLVIGVPQTFEYLDKMQERVTNIHCLTIIGQIEGHVQLPPQNKTTKYEHVIPQIVAVEQNPKIEGLLIILNTVGGDVEAGLAIAEMLLR
ncbi:hypothetical protein DT075_26245 [Bacillus licheniformis]|nr:hypothetical protein DT075_26245 [Bacillus licheniformis]